MTAAQKQRVKANLLQFMENHPRMAQVSFVRRFARVLAVRPFQVALAALVLMIVVGGSVSYAASDALPGSLLYPIKIYVNEEIHAALISSPTAKTEYAIRRAELRLQEGEQLQSQNQLTEGNQTQVQTQFQAQARAAEQGIAKIQEQGNGDRADQLSQSFVQTLKIHQKVLSDEGKKNRHSDAAGLENSINQSLESMAKVQASGKANNSGKDKKSRGSEDQKGKNNNNNAKIENGPDIKANIDINTNINVNTNSNSNSSVEVNEKNDSHRDVNIVPSNQAAPSNTEIRVQDGF